MSPMTETDSAILEVENYKVGFRTERGLAKAAMAFHFP